MWTIPQVGYCSSWTVRCIVHLQKTSNESVFLYYLLTNWSPTRHDHHKPLAGINLYIIQNLLFLMRLSFWCLVTSAALVDTICCLCSTDTYIMNLCRVRNVSDTRVDTRVVYILKNLLRVQMSCPFQCYRVRVT